MLTAITDQSDLSLAAPHRVTTGAPFAVVPYSIGLFDHPDSLQIDGRFGGWVE
jgi:hypothetical protein